MKCSDLDRILPDILDGVPINGSQDLEVQSHLKTCPDCSELVSDLKLIASEARHLSDSEEPSPRVWACIATELRAEGLIREPELETARPVLVPARQRRWNPFWLAPVAAAIVVAGSYLLIHHPAQHATAQVAQQSAGQPSGAPIAQQPIAQQPTAQQPATQQPAQQQASVPSSQSPIALPDQTPQGPVEQADLSPPVSDNEFLSEVSTRAPGMRATYANQLQAVNKEIRETKAYLSQYPGDIDARQHLLEVYQQKEMLYQMALDRIQ